MVLFDVIVFAAKLAFGTLAFLAIGFIGASNDKRIAGAMLTFPVLNGIGLLTSPDKDPNAIVGVMMPLIVLNGTLCFVFIAAFRWARRRISAPADAPLSYGIGAVCGLAWCACALWLIPALEPELPSPAAIAAIYIVVSVVLAWAWWSTDTPTVATAPRQPFVALWWQRRWRVAFFIASLFALLIAANVGDAAWVGRLSALPLMPLCVVAGITIDDGASLPSIRDTVLLGPGVAMVFALALGAVLADLHGVPGLGYWGPGMLALAVGWAVAIAAIRFGIPPIAAALDRRRSRPAIGR